MSSTTVKGPSLLATGLSLTITVADALASSFVAVVVSICTVPMRATA